MEELTKMGDMDSERLLDIYEHLDELDAATAETKAARILHGLGTSHNESLPVEYTCHNESLPVE